MSVSTPAAPDQHAPSCLMSNLGWLLDHASHVLATEMAVALAPLGLGSRGYCVLSTALGRELTQKQLSSEIGIDKTTLVVTLDELERLGLAERTTSRNDRRARVIRVTEAGARKLAEGQAIVESVQGDVLSALPEAEREALLAALRRLAEERLSAPMACSPPLRRREARAT